MPCRGPKAERRPRTGQPWTRRRPAAGVATALCGFVICLAIAVGSPAYGETLRFATGNDYKPFADESLPNGGLATEVIRAAFERVGQDVEIDVMPWPRVLQMASEGAYDGAFPYIKSEERLDSFRYSDAITVVDQVAFARKDDDISAATPAELSDGTFCYPAGYALYDSLSSRMAEGGLYRRKPKDMGTCFEALHSGDVDFVAAPRWQGWITATDVIGSPRGIKILDLVFDRIGNHLIVAGDHPSAAYILKLFNEGLRRIEADGTYDRILERHLAPLRYSGHDK